MKDAKKPKAPPAFLVKIILGFIEFLRKLQLKILPPQAVLINHILGDIVTHRSLYVAAELGIADLLKDGPKSVDQLAQECKTHADSLNRIMRILSAMGLFKRRKDNQFEITKLGKAMCSDEQDTMLYFAKLVGKDYIYKIFSGLPESIKNGKNFYENTYGESLFDWLEKNPISQKEFDDGMTSTSSQSDVAVAAAYNFSSFETIVDVGGGRATQLSAILKANPKLKGILYELPLAIGLVATSNFLEETGLVDRVELEEGNFLESVPANGDCYFLKSILQDWDDENALKILKNCRKAMENDSTLIIAEMVVKDDNAMHFSKILDISLLSLMGGRIRTETEFIHLFKKAGFELKRIIPTAGPTDIVEAKPV